MMEMYIAMGQQGFKSIPFVVVTIPSFFPLLCLFIEFLSRRMPLVERKMPTRLEHHVSFQTFIL
jgi:hypothetical protein